MYDYQNLKLIHRHGSDWAELHQAGHHDAAEHDPERRWGKGARIFKCDTCEEQVVVIPPDAPEEAGAAR